MKFSITHLLTVLALMQFGFAHADIYENKDAEGNVVYSDEPAPGAEAVDLPQTNISDHVEPIPGEKPLSEPTQASASSQEEGSDVVVIPDSRNEEVQRDFEADMPHEVLDAEKRHEVGDFPSEAELQRREEAQEGEITDADGNTVIYKHQGHAGE